MIRRFILLSIDSLRFDALSCEADTRYLQRYRLEGQRHTPNLDALAAQGVRIRQAIATAPYTTASHASMLTGDYPPRHGVRAFLSHELSRSARTVAERLRGAGYRTIGALDFEELFRVSNLTRGFDEVIKCDDRALFQRLSACRERPLFLFVHFNDVHAPYDESPCPPYDGYNNDSCFEWVRIAEELGLLRAEREALTQEAGMGSDDQLRRHCQIRGIPDTVMFPWYLKGVNKFDGGRLRVFLDRLRKLQLLDDESFLIVTADHGEAPLPVEKRANGENRRTFYHMEAVVEELIRVPLIFVAPGRLPEGRILDTQVSLVDLVPTILDYAGLRAWKDCDGVTLRGLLEGTWETAGSCAYSETWFDRVSLLRAQELRKGTKPHPLQERRDTFLVQASVRTPRYKYVETGGDLTDDEMALPAADFARTAIRKLHGRLEHPAELNGMVTALKRGARRGALIAELQGQHFHRCVLYDLSSDPFETVNLLGLDIVHRALDGSPRYADIAESLRKHLRSIRGNPKTASAASPRLGDGSRHDARRLGIERESTELPGVVDDADLARARIDLRRASACSDAGDLKEMRAQLLHALRRNPWTVRYTWARIEIAWMGHLLAAYSDSPVAATRTLCREIRSALAGLGRGNAWVRYVLADVWTEVAVRLGMGWGGPTDVRAAGIAAFSAVINDPGRLRRKVLLWLIARGTLGPLLADPIVAVLRRMMHRAA